MKSDLTCPVEITKVTVSREQTEGTKEHEQIVCLIEFFNLSQKVIDSLQMNIICFDKDGVRLGGRLVRAAATGVPARSCPIGWTARCAWTPRWRRSGSRMA